MLKIKVWTWSLGTFFAVSALRCLGTCHSRNALYA